MYQRAHSNRSNVVVSSSIVALCLGWVQVCAQTTPAIPLQQNAFAYPLPLDRGATGLAQTLRQLHTRASLIQINAHPDDEDGGMLTYVSRAQGADVSLLSLNRGEGGQNVMTGDFWDALGILRTQEHLAANRYYGDHLYYTSVADFGFSKTLEETLSQWTHERVLADTVRVVRMTRPMIVTSVFAAYVSDGHGHHQASGLMAQEVYNAAADPNRFPEQLREGLRPWAPLKMYARVPFARVSEHGIFDYATGKWAPLAFRNYITGQQIEGVPQATVYIPEGTYDPHSGEDFLQIAREGLNQQKSQNGGTGVSLPGHFDSPYHLYASRVAKGPLPAHEDSMFDGIDTSLPGIATYLPAVEQPDVRGKLQAVAGAIDEATSRYNANDPTLSAVALARGLDETREVIAQLGATPTDDAHYNALHELQTKETQLQLALKQALGVTLLAVVQPGGSAQGNCGPRGPADTATFSVNASTSVIAGQTFDVNVHLADQGAEPISIDAVRVTSSNVDGTSSQGNDWNTHIAGDMPTALGPSQGKDVLFTATVPQGTPETGPYFSRPNLEQSYYDLQTPSFLSLPNMPYPLLATVDYTFRGTHLSLTSVVQTARRENGQGIVVNPLLVAPAISIRMSPRAGVVPLQAVKVPLDVTVHSSVKGPVAGSLQLKLPAGWTASPTNPDFAVARENEEITLHFDLKPSNLQAIAYTITAAATYNGKEYTQGFTTIGYPGVRPYPQYAPARYRTTGIDVQVAPDLRVAYVMGTGDDVPRSLENIGIHVVELSPADIATANLSEYDAIVLGIRTYAARPELRTFNGRLLEYVRKGGVVISEYQTAEYDQNYGPYPLSVPENAEKVVEEGAPVRILKSGDPALTYPNHIGLQDFDGWVEERGHGFPRSFDARYTALTETHDAGQDPQTGGILYARYGKGYYAYLAYAFFRQMPEGVPGSYRIMANLLSLGKNPELSH